PHAARVVSFDFSPPLPYKPLQSFIIVSFGCPPLRRGGTVSASVVLVLQEKQLAIGSEKSRFFRRPEFWMVLAGFAVRMAGMPFLIGEQLSPERDHWCFGYEAGRIAKSIIQGHGFSSPLFSDTGPTAWMTPVYPYIVAGFFKVFGLYTLTAAVALL